MVSQLTTRSLPGTSHPKNPPEMGLWTEQGLRPWSPRPTVRSTEGLTGPCPAPGRSPTWTSPSHPQTSPGATVRKARVGAAARGGAADQGVALTSPLSQDSLSRAILRLHLLLEIGAPSTLLPGGNLLSATRVYFAELYRCLGGSTASDSGGRPTEGRRHVPDTGASARASIYLTPL